MSKGVIYNIQRMSTQDGPGLRTTVFFKGCPLACRWCGNPESQNGLPQHLHFSNLCTSCGGCVDVCKNGAVAIQEGKVIRDLTKCKSCGECVSICPASAATISGKEYDVDEVMRAVLKDAAFYMTSEGGVTFSGGECTMQGDFLLECLDACIESGFHCTVDTCAHTRPEIFNKVLEKADLLLFDIKHMDSDAHRTLTGVPNELIQKNLAIALENMPEKLCIRVPLMQDLNDSKENIEAMSALLLPYGVENVEVIPCHTFGKSKYDALYLPRPEMKPYKPEDLQKVLERFADAGLSVEIV